MPEEQEIVIAGGGLVGTVLGIALARRGLSATILERSATTPEVLRGELIMPAGVAVLDRLGLGERVRRVAIETEGTCLHHPAFPSGEIQVDYAIAPAPIDVPEETWKPRGLCGWRRPLYEELRAVAHATPGLEYRDGFEVTGARRDECGIVLEGKGRDPLRARMVVAADGYNSLLRRALGFEPAYSEQRTFVQGFVGRSPTYKRRHVHVGVHAVGAAFVFPFPEGHFRSTIEYKQELRDELRGRDGKDALARHLEVLREALPEIFSELGELEPRTEVHVQPGNSITLASVVEDGFALVGDAAGCLDPFAGFGMAMGLTDAELLADTLAGRDFSARALRVYERKRWPGIVARREATEHLGYIFLDKSEGFADLWAARLGERWADRQWILPMVAAQFAGYDAVVEPSPGMKNHFLGLL